ncbi:hypothetical protein ARNL5_02143 [Anaerolineae bacterium]|nr:hypothetical protein ARNL5_02143 [Anaerolineae bacterium]
MNDFHGIHDDFPRLIQFDFERQILKARVFADFFPSHNQPHIDYRTRNDWLNEWLVVDFIGFDQIANHRNEGVQGVADIITHNVE